MPRDEDNDLRGGFTTSPPPEGEDDPYGAPTKVARVPDKVLDELMRARAETTRADATPTDATPTDATPADATPADATPADAAANDLSSLAAAASHVVVPPRPKAPPLASTTPLAATPAAASPVDAIPCLHDEAAREDTAELPSKPAAAPLPQPVQSGRTVPLSAALLADVLKSVDDRRAAAEAAAAAAPSAPPVPLDAPRRSRRPMVALAVVLAIGLSVFVTGVVMFLDALE